MSSPLAIALILSTATAFSVVPNHPPVVLVPAATANDPRACNINVQRARTPFSFAAAPKSSEGTSTPTTTSKVKDMATFLATQLLEKALAEAMKEDSNKDKKMNMDDLQKLIQAFQSSPSLATKEQLAQDEQLEPTYKAAGEAVAETLADKSMEDLVDATVEPKALDTDEKAAVEEATFLADTKETANIAAEKENKLAAEKAATEARVKAEEEARLQAETKKAEEEASTTQPLPLSAARASSPLPAGIPVRIPDVISKVLGRPLEVMLSNVPPLREESIPKKNLKIDDQEMKEDNNKSKDAEATSKETKTEGLLEVPDDVEVGDVNEDILKPKAAISSMDLTVVAGNQETETLSSSSPESVLSDATTLTEKSNQEKKVEEATYERAAKEEATKKAETEALKAAEEKAAAEEAAARAAVEEATKKAEAEAFKAAEEKAAAEEAAAARAAAEEATKKAEAEAFKAAEEKALAEAAVEAAEAAVEEKRAKAAKTEALKKTWEEAGVEETAEEKAAKEVEAKDFEAAVKELKRRKAEAAAAAEERAFQGAAKATAAKAAKKEAAKAAQAFKVAEREASGKVKTVAPTIEPATVTNIKPIGKFLEGIRNWLRNPRPIPLTSDNATAVTTPTTIFADVGSPPQGIAKARQQPKFPADEKLLADRYGSMPLEERAFAILYDLGMVEMN